MTAKSGSPVSAPVHHLSIITASTYAMIFTSFPRAPASISRANSSARSSIEADGGTVAVITSTPCAVNASLIPRQYCTPGKYRPASRISSKPRRPWARTTGCFGASVVQSYQLGDTQCDIGELGFAAHRSDLGLPSIGRG